jgi:hypothetical protein
MTDVPQKDGPEEIVFQGKMIEVVHQPMKHNGIVQTYEWAQRAPGVRIIIPDYETKELILTREYRAELDAFDIRLPGGKVFNSLNEWNQHKQTGEDIESIALEKVKEEGLEEAGIEIDEARLVAISKNGAMMHWDLLYFVADKWHEHEDGAQHQEFEQGVTSVARYKFDEVENLLRDGSISEDRSVAALVRWLGQQN